MNFTNIVDAVTHYQANGYEREFRVVDGDLYDLASGDTFPADAITVEEAFRFQGADDDANLYVISLHEDADGGTLIDAFDLVADESNDALRAQLEAVELEYVADPNDGRPLRYGLPKILKADFNEDPERYVLRKGFPDFPTCPFGQSYQMLGFDRQDEKYVWLVTSIIKDDRLIEEEFAG